MLAVALPEVPDAYDEVVSYDKSRGIYYMSSQDVAKSLQTEKQIYGTPCNNKQDYGPIYCSPSDDETKLYQEFEGKKFQNLCHKEMKLVVLVYCTLICRPCTLLPPWMVHTLLQLHFCENM